MIKALIFDLDQTLIESHHVEYLRKTRNWPAVYREIPTIQAYDGINQLLLNAKEKDIELAIVTSSPESYVQRIIDHFDWFFDAKVCYHDTKLHKPDPAPFVEAINRLVVKTGDCWAIGDDPKDIIAAKAANIYSVGALWGSINKQCLIDAEPDVLFESVTSLSYTISQFK